LVLVPALMSRLAEISRSVDFDDFALKCFLTAVGENAAVAENKDAHRSDEPRTDCSRITHPNRPVRRFVRCGSGDSSGVGEGLNRTRMVPSGSRIGPGNAGTE
jgi:hypothetical protein